MPDLTKEQFEGLPDYIKQDYTEIDGVYKHAGVVKMKGTLNDLDAKLKERDGQYNSLNERLSTFEQDKAKAIEEARAKALEEARGKGDIEAIEQRYQEQMADLEKRSFESGRSEAQKEYTLKAAQSQAELELTEIVAALKPKDDGSASLIKAYLKGKQQVSEDGKIIYLNEDGSASTLDKSGFLAEQVKSTMFDPLRIAEPTSSGGGKTNGSTGGGSAEPTGANQAQANLRKRLQQQGLTR